jgi:hypothetical protein
VKGIAKNSTKPVKFGKRNNSVAKTVKGNVATAKGSRSFTAIKHDNKSIPKSPKLDVKGP